MLLDVSKSLSIAKEKLFQLIIIPFKFWFGLPVFIHYIVYFLLVWFVIYLAYIIYVNRTEIFKIP